MPNIDTHGLRAPEDGDPFAPAADMRADRAPLHARVIVPVPNQSARDVLASAHSPTTSKPLFVYVADIDKVQYTIDGSEWWNFSANQDTETALVLTDTTNFEWRPGEEPYLLREGTAITINGSMTQLTTTYVGQTWRHFATVPPEFRPRYQSYGAAVSNDGRLYELAVLVNGNLSIRAQAGETAAVGAAVFYLNFAWRA